MQPRRFDGRLGLARCLPSCMGRIMTKWLADAGLRPSGRSFWIPRLAESRFQRCDELLEAGEFFRIVPADQVCSLDGAKAHGRPDVFDEHGNEFSLRVAFLRFLLDPLTFY